MKKLNGYQTGFFGNIINIQNLNNIILPPSTSLPFPFAGEKKANIRSFRYPADL